MHATYPAQHFLLDFVPEGNTTLRNLVMFDKFIGITFVEFVTL